MSDFKDRLAVVPNFAATAAFEVLRNPVLRNLTGERVHIPVHKRGATVAYQQVRSRFPEVARFYESHELSGVITGIVGERVRPTPLHDQSSCSILVYDRPGDRIGWHYDYNFYRGRHFTALLSLANECRSESRLSSARLLVKRNDCEVEVPTPPNTLVLFEGKAVRHCVTALEDNELRVILSMTFCTNPETTRFKDVQRRFKDIAYLGIRALWS